ncbi:MAG TPA: dTDP-4-dehydrorhamnose reductase [Smithellaceae bacterium]|nr:dTDP-4-dehydrorhamnose reductase [Smithellaceae bacterium]
MKVLLLGHKGMLGSDLAAQFRHRHEVVGMDMDDIDITREGDVHRAVGEVCPQIVINAAAYTNVDGCETDRDACYAVNAEAVKNIASACKGKGILIIHYSTDYVFDGTQTKPYEEDHPCRPVSVYGASKLAGEKYLQEIADDWLIIRTAWLYGLKGRNFVSAILEKAATTGALTVVDDQIGSPTCTRDLAAATELLHDKKGRGIFHVTNRGYCSWFEFAKRILKEANLEHVSLAAIKTSELKRSAPRPAYSVLSMQKFMNATGKTMQPWQLAFSDYYKYVTSRTCLADASLVKIRD